MEHITHQSLRDIPPLATKELDINDLFQAFTVEEALKIAYIPIVLTKSAFEYADFARQICVAKRLPNAKESRIIKEAFAEYERGIMNELREEVKEGLENKMEYFFDEADREIQTLWYSISGELKKEYPELDNYDLLTNIYTAVAILDYVRKFECSAAIEIMRRTGTGYACMENKYSIRVRNALLKIAGKYTMKNTDMLKLAIRVLAIKVDGMIKVEYDNN